MPFTPQPPVDTEFKRQLTLPAGPPAHEQSEPDAADAVLAAMEAAHAAMRAGGGLEAAAAAALQRRGLRTP